MNRAQEYELMSILDLYSQKLIELGATTTEIKFQRLVIHNFVKNILPGLGYSLVRTR